MGFLRDDAFKNAADIKYSIKKPTQPATIMSNISTSMSLDGLNIHTAATDKAPPTDATRTDNLWPGEATLPKRLCV